MIQSNLKNKVKYHLTNSWNMLFTGSHPQIIEIIN